MRLLGKQSKNIDVVYCLKQCIFDFAKQFIVTIFKPLVIVKKWLFCNQRLTCCLQFCCLTQITAKHSQTTYNFEFSDQLQKSPSTSQPLGPHYQTDSVMSVVVFVVVVENDHSQSGQLMFLQHPKFAALASSASVELLLKR